MDYKLGVAQALKEQIGDALPIEKIVSLLEIGRASCRERVF